MTPLINQDKRKWTVSLKRETIRLVYFFLLMSPLGQCDRIKSLRENKIFQKFNQNSFDRSQWFMTILAFTSWLFQNVFNNLLLYENICCRNLWIGSDAKLLSKHQVCLNLSGTTLRFQIWLKFSKAPLLTLSGEKNWRCQNLIFKDV